MSEKIATFKDLDTIASLVEGTTSGYISGAISNMCVSKRNFDIVSSKTIAAVGNGLILKGNSDSSEYDPDRLILKDDVEITKTKCTIILSGESKQYHNTAFVRCTASVDGKLYWGESENAMTNQIEITAEVEANVISRTSVGTTAIYAYFVPTNPIYPTLGGQGDSYVSASAEITKAEDAGISVTTYSKTYNGSAQEVAACTSSHGTSEWYIGYTTTSSSTNVTWGEKNTNLSLTNAGTYYIWKKWKGDSNHNSHDGVKMDATVIISNATFTVSASNQTYTYNGSAQGAAITVSNLVGGQTATIKYGTTSGLYNTTTVPKITNANEDKTIYWQVTALNHATQTGSYTLTMNQRSVTVTAGSTSKVYDGAVLTYNSASLSGQVSGHTLNSYTCTGSITNVGSVNNVPSSAKIYSGTTDVTENYSITYKSGTLTVTKATPTLTLTGALKTYDGNMYYVSAKASVAGTVYYGTTSATSGMTSAKAVSANTATNLTGRKHAGTTNVYAYFVPTDTTNYSSLGSSSNDHASASVVISKTMGYLTATTTNRTYTGSAQTIASIATNSGTYYFSLGTSATSAPSLWYTLDAALTATDAGTYYVWAKCDASNNYTAVAAKYIGTVTISQKSVTYTATNQSKTYDGSALSAAATASLTSGGLVSGHTATFTCSGSQTTVGTSTKTLSGVTIKNSSGTDVTSNYAVTKKNGTLTVSNAAFTVSAPNQTYTYTGSAQGAAITVSGLVGGQTATIMYGTTSGSYNTTTVPKITNANEDRTIYWQVTASNHATQTGSYTITMNQANGSGSVTMSGWTYGGTVTNPTPSSSANGTGSVTYTWYNSSKTALGAKPTSTSSVGDYYVKATFAATTNYTSYTTDYVKFTISNAVFTVSASNQTYTYNGSAQGAAITVTNLKGSQTATIMYGTTSGSYNTTTVPKITNANEDKTIYWEVTAPNHATQTGSYTITMNQANGSGSVTMSGWTYGGTVTNPTPTSSTNRTSNVTYTWYNSSKTALSAKPSSTSTVGTYYVKATFAATTNYTSYTTDYVSFSISNATFTVSAPNQAYRYTGSAQGDAITVSGLKGNQTATIMYGTTNGSYTTTTVPKITNANEDKTIYWQVTAPNHVTQTGRYTLTINKATPTLTLTGVTKTYDGNTYCVSANASVAGTVYYGTTSGSMQYKINATANRTVNLASISRTTVGTTTVYAYLVPTDSTNYNNSTNVSARISIGQVSSTLSYTPEDVQTYCLNSTSALVKSQIVECMGAQGGGKFNYEVVAYDQEGSTISGFDISKYYLWTIEEGGGVVKGIVTYKRNPMEMTLSDIVCIYLVDAQGMEAYVGLDNHRDVDEPWTHVANTSTDGENILKLAWSADGGEGIDEYTFSSELSDVPFDTFAISIPEGLSVGDYNIAITVKQADSNYVYDEVTRIFVLSVLPDEHTGVYDGTLSINTSATLSAGEASRVITWGAVYTNWKYGGDKVYYPYPSNLSIECTNSAASGFVSIDKISYSNSEQVTTSVLTKQSFRDTKLSYITTYKISLLTYNGSLVKSINVNASSNISTLKSTRIEYGTPTILVADTLTPGASRATVTCEVWNKDINTYTWTSGYESESEGASTAGGTTWSIKSQTFTSKSSSGSSTIYRFSQNNNTLSHSSMGTNVGTDKVILTAVNADAALAGVTTTGVNKTISVYNDKKHTITSLSVSYTAINAGVTTSRPTVTYNTSYNYLSGSAGGTTTGNTWTYSSLPLFNVEKTLTPSFSISGSTTYATIDSESGVVTWKTANGTTSARTCYVNCSASLTSQGQTTTASTASSVAVTQNGLSGGGTGGGTVTGNTRITFYGSVGTTVPYTVTLDNQTISIPGTYDVPNRSPFIVVTARNNTTVQKHVSVTCSNASGVTASMQPNSGQITLNKKGQSGETDLITVSLTRPSTVASASVDIYIATD